ncbi:restriction endonuclease [Myroides odoratimimus]|uniref:restriction endonuclease n=1 Tax=Myroides odoratimimus TaxID=76832 RepID=UPI0026E04AA3|nr:restriction endonuclease [Myroides odoratimimus]MDO5858621.1 restriction endonuclease [Myroides odoratimimus]
MTIPKHDELRIPILEILSDGKEYKLKQFQKPLAQKFNLTEDQVYEMYPSGNGHIFYDRISWALSYLNMAGLLDKPARGIYAINTTAKELLKTPEKINSYIESKMSKRDKKKISNGEVTNDFNITKIQEDATPSEKLYASFENIKNTVYESIIEVILSKSPTSFERLVVKLLQKMGYGGEVKDSGLVTKASNDGGIDGVIKEDVLGFGRIYIQAKRFNAKSPVGRQDIQGFVGALAVAQSNKGVFITTSYFTQGARDFVMSLNGSATVVLIDGKDLAKYIYEYGLGMQVEQTIEIKKLDTDFWDDFEDDKSL